jgi:hypothetical protein
MYWARIHRTLRLVMFSLKLSLTLAQMRSSQMMSRTLGRATSRPRIPLTFPPVIFSQLILLAMYQVIVALRPLTSSQSSMFTFPLGMCFRCLVLPFCLEMSFQSQTVQLIQLMCSQSLVSLIYLVFSCVLLNPFRVWPPVRDN